MAFQLKKGTSTFDFDLDGKVTKNGADFGKWATTKDKFCRIAVTKDDGTQDLHEAVWKFEKNQLCLFQGDSKIFNFQSANKPTFSVTDKAVLKVSPQAGKDFAFELRGEWDLTNDFDISFSVNENSSVIDGFIENDKSMFDYFFVDDTEMYALSFAGKWDGDTNEHGKDGSIILRYHFEREDGSLDEFSLPASATFDKTINQFVYSFEKSDGSTKCSLTLVGLINVGKDSKITYSISVQKQDGKEKVLSSVIQLNAVMVTDKLEGSLDVKYTFLKKDGSETENVLSIGGKFKFDKATLQIVFQYKSVGKTRNIFFGGKLDLTDSGTGIAWGFSKENNVKTLTITISDFKFGNKVTVNSELVVKSKDGSKKKSISFILGVTLKV